MLVIDVLDLDLLILMSDPESGATLTAIGIDRFSAVCSRSRAALLSAEEAGNILRGLKTLEQTICVIAKHFVENI